MIGKGDEMTEQPSMIALLNQANEIFYRVGNGTGEVVMELDRSLDRYIRVGIPFRSRHAAPFSGYGVYFVRSACNPPYNMNIVNVSATIKEELLLTEVYDASTLSEAVSCLPELYTRLVDKVAELRRHEAHSFTYLQKFVEAHKEQE